MRKCRGGRRDLEVMLFAESLVSVGCPHLVMGDLCCAYDGDDDNDDTDDDHHPSHNHDADITKTTMTTTMMTMTMTITTPATPT